VLILDELARLGVKVHFSDAPNLAPDDPQSVLLTQVQGVIAEYEKAKIAERHRRGKLFRARAGEITTWKAPYGYRRIPRSDTTGPAHLEIYEPEAALVRRIFTDRAAGVSVRQICCSLNTDQIPSPAGKPGWPYSTVSRLLRNQAYIGRVYYNRTESVPNPRRIHRNHQVPRGRQEWIPLDCPARWPSTVRRLRYRRWAISALVYPAAMSPRTWISRSLSSAGAMSRVASRAPMVGCR
jgi:site-specific DNA recombinase